MIWTCICEPRNKKAQDIVISADVVKKVHNEIFPILKYIFNISLAKQVFPEKLKIARVRSTLKKGNNTPVTNYRPTLVLPFFEKCSSLSWTHNV